MPRRTGCVVTSATVDITTTQTFTDLVGTRDFLSVTGTQVWDVMPIDKFRLRSAIWWLSNEFSGALKKHKSKLQDQAALAALERKWSVIFVSRLVLQHTKG